MKLRTQVWHFVGIGSICLTLFLLNLRDGHQVELISQSSETLVKGFKPGVSFFTLYYKSDAVGDVQTTKSYGLNDGFVYDVLTHFRLSAFSQDLEIEMMLNAEFDRFFGLSQLRFSMESGDTSVTGHGTVTGNNLNVSVLTGGNESTYTLPYDRELIIGSVLGSRVTADNLKPGDVRRLKLFDPLSQTVRKVKLTAVGYEELLMLDRKISALKIEQETMGVVLNGWVAADGEMIRQELGLGLVAQLEPRSTVDYRKRKGSRRVDLVQELLIPVSGMPSDFAARKRMNFKLNNLPPSMRLTSGIHQVWKGQTLTINRVDKPEHVPFEPSKVPLKSDDRFAQSELPEVRSVALEMAGDAASVGSLVLRALSWFDTEIKQAPVASLPSSSETLRTRTGDCNEHAFLFAGMMRSLGVDTEIVTGIAYVPRLNRFGYHAWNEVKFGELMIPIDATWQQFPADATHIGLVRGGLQAQSSLWSLMGRLKVQVLPVDE
jgi:hypothetical protein